MMAGKYMNQKMTIREWSDLLVSIGVELYSDRALSPILLYSCSRTADKGLVP